MLYNKIYGGDNMDEEIWKLIDNTIEPRIMLNLYKISNYGKIYNIKTNRYFTVGKNRSSVSMYDNQSKEITVIVARIVYKAFIGYLPDNMKIWYKDNNKNNLYYENLYAVTWSEYKHIKFNLNALSNTGLSYRDMSSCGYYQNGAKIMCYNIDEKWKDITQDHVPEIQPWYLVSNYGRIYSKATNSIIKTSIINTGYERVQLINIHNKKIDLLVHRLVALVWIGFPPSNDKTEVNHKDANPFHNYPDNLEWVTPDENLHYITDAERSEYYEKTFSDDTIMAICQAIENGMDYANICFNILHCQYNSNLHRRLWLIHKYKIHTNISSHYNF